MLEISSGDFWGEVMTEGHEGAFEEPDVFYCWIWVVAV